MSAEALELLEVRASWAPGALVCPRCDGEGELHFNASWPVDPQHDDYYECPRCQGTGEITCPSA